MPLSTFNVPNLSIAPSTSETTAKHLHEAIIAGHFAENEPIHQGDIAQLFNVSKIPVREILRHLEAEDLVLLRHNRGAVVTRISEPELAQTFEVRVPPKAQAIRLAVPSMDGTTFARAETVCAGFIDEDNVGCQAELNWQLYAYLYEPTQRPFLVNLIRSIHDKLKRCLHMQMSLSEDKQHADQEHYEIIATCRAGDAGRTAALIEAHIVGVCRTFHEHPPSRPANT